MSLLNFVRYILDLKNVEIVEQIAIYSGTKEIIKINLNEINLKKWYCQYDGTELTINFYNQDIDCVPKILQPSFEIFRLSFKEHRIENIRLEKSKIHDFCHFMIQVRNDLHYYLKIFIPFDQIQSIKDYVKQKNLTKQVNIDKFD
ncbi:MAG: hypothetical protein EAX96_09055 [Candidatus Lokiarchaeota archaeon]|nr:hypothetical protein [Candidatus Lokiarchaeota archaeon]